MTIWFTADTHFGHANILRFHPRRGADLAEMNGNLIDRWNDVVGPRDEVWFLGDFAMGPSADIPGFFHALKGRKHLIRGNHDHGPTVRLPWTSIDSLREWRQRPHRAVLCHYPMLTWSAAHYGVWMLHGHSHGLLEPTTTTRMDVGIDTHPDLRPYSLDEIVAEMDSRQYIAVDGHTRPPRPEQLQAIRRGG